MSWEPIVRAARGEKTGIWISLSKKDVRIVLGEDILKLLRVKSDDRIAFDVGRDDHLGRGRLRVDRNGYRIRNPNNKSKALGFSFRKWSDLMEDPCSPIQVPFKVTGDAILEVTLPYWGQPQKLKARVAR